MIGEPEADYFHGAPRNVTIDGNKQARYVFVADEDKEVGCIGVEFSYHHAQIPNGEQLSVRLAAARGYREKGIVPDLDMAARNREVYPWRGDICSALRFVTFEPLLVEKGERLVLRLSAPAGGGYQVWLRDARSMIVAKDMLFSKLESSINGGGSWEHVGYRDMNASGFLLLPV